MLVGVRVSSRRVLQQLGLTLRLLRFEGYSRAYDAAAARAWAGRHDWVDGVGIDSCHVVWMELHEDLLATLGLQRSHGN